MDERSASGASRPLLPIAFAALAVMARLPSLAGLHPLVWDEIEFFRATDWVRRGLVPYRDFWEHHTPLQWFLFAPLSGIVDSPGVASIIAMRVWQLPLWLVTFALLMLWMKRAGLASWERWAGVVVGLCSSMFMLPAVEYRVDVAGCCFVLLGLVFAQRMNASRRWAMLAGAAFALAGLANLRLGPLLVAAVLLLQFVRPDDGAWGLRRRAGWIFAGAAAVAIVWLGYALVTHSLAITIRSVLIDNYVADRNAPQPSHMFLTRLGAQFGLRRDGERLWWEASGIDPAGIVVLVVGAIGMIRVLVTRRRRPDDRFVLAVLTAANVLFIAAMKFVYNYHLLIVVLMLVPFVAAELERFGRQRTVLAALAVLLCVNAAVSIFRGKEADTRYQNLIMNEVDRRTPPGSKVWDSAGWALHRTPAYRYWFLRAIVPVLVKHGDFAPYRPQDLLADPPAAVVADYDTRGWMAFHPDLGRVVVRHYLPLWRDLWAPGLSARLTPAAPRVTWLVPSDGTYRLVASERLASHPWFRSPLFFDPRPWSVGPSVSDASASGTQNSIPPVDLDAPIDHGAVLLKRGQMLTATSRAAAPIGVMLIRENPGELFRRPPPGVTLEGSQTPRWHVPEWPLW